MLRPGEAIRPVLDAETVHALACAFLEPTGLEQERLVERVSECGASSTSEVEGKQDEQHTHRTPLEPNFRAETPSYEKKDVRVRVGRELSGYEDRNFLLALETGGPDRPASGQRLVLKVANLLDSQCPELLGTQTSTPLHSSFFQLL